MHKKLILICLVLLVIAGCTANLSPQEIYEKSNEAFQNLDSYSMDIEMTFETNISSTLINEFNGDTKINMNGDIDNVNNNGHFDLTMDFSGSKIEGSTYLVDGYIYSRSGSFWAKRKYDEKVWRQVDNSNMFSNLGEFVEVRPKSDEMIDGVDYYVLEVVPDMEKVSEFALQQQYLSLSDEISLDDTVSEYLVTFWINKDTLMIEKALIYMEMNLEDYFRGKDSTAKGKIISEINYRIYNMNEQIDIVLPEEAQNAIEFGG